mmetsp:Transcript_7698/g.22842  ORF Transcript_7698/g.22842 Transcript_7698/m.22842 type:complete len:296 (-) Transcript_7698:873-1760(-)
MRSPPSTSAGGGRIVRHATAAVSSMASEAPPNTYAAPETGACEGVRARAYAYDMEPADGPAALTPEAMDIATPLTLPRWSASQDSLMRQNMAVKQFETMTRCRTLWTKSAAQVAGAGTGAIRAMNCGTSINPAAHAVLKGNNVRGPQRAEMDGKTRNWYKTDTTAVADRFTPIWPASIAMPPSARGVRHQSGYLSTRVEARSLDARRGPLGAGARASSKKIVRNESAQYTTMGVHDARGTPEHTPPLAGATSSSSASSLAPSLLYPEPFESSGSQRSTTSTATKARAAPIILGIA